MKLITAITTTMATSDQTDAQPYEISEEDESFFMDLMNELHLPPGSKKTEKTVPQAYAAYIVVGKQLANMRWEHVGTVNERFGDPRQRIIDEGYDVSAWPSDKEAAIAADRPSMSTMTSWFSPKSEEIEELQHRMQQEVFYMQGLMNRLLCSEIELRFRVFNERLDVYFDWLKEEREVYDALPELKNAIIR